MEQTEWDEHMTKYPPLKGSLQKQVIMENLNEVIVLDFHSLLDKVIAALAGTAGSLQNGSHILLSLELSSHHSCLDLSERVSPQNRNGQTATKRG